MSTFRTPLREAMERSRRFLGDSQRQESEPQGQSTLLDHISIRERVRAEARLVIGSLLQVLQQAIRGEVLNIMLL